MIPKLVKVENGGPAIDTACLDVFGCLPCFWLPPCHDNIPELASSARRARGVDVDVGSVNVQ